MCIDNLINQLEVIEQQSLHSPLLISKPNKDHERFFSQLCQTYIKISSPQRDVVCDAVRRKANVMNGLLGYIYCCANQVRKTGNKVWLEIGLAAGSMRGNGSDFRDFYLALAELYVAADAAGLKPGLSFDNIGGGVPKNFKNYAVVKSRLASEAKK